MTVHRLLWEYGRDSFGVRAGRSFSEDEWRAWLGEIATQYRAGIEQFTLKSLGDTASRPDLSESEVDARLSDIIDGQFMIGTPRPASISRRWWLRMRSARRCLRGSTPCAVQRLTP